MDTLYYEGYCAYMAGKWPAECPFEMETPEFREWNAGFQKAIEEEEDAYLGRLKPRIKGK